MNKLFFVLLIVIIGCSTTSQAESRFANDDLTNKIVKFWEFVSKNEKALFTANINDPAIYEETTEQAHLINENLYIFIGNDIINNKRDLIISSGVNPDYFELCDRIVGSAPVFATINPVSLIPPSDNTDIYAIGNMVLNLEDIQVHFDDDDDNLDLLFLLSNNHLANIQNDNSGQVYSMYLQALFSMTLQLLGERTFVNKIESLDLIPLPLIMPSIPFMELRKYIENGQTKSGS